MKEDSEGTIFEDLVDDFNFVKRNWRIWGKIKSIFLYNYIKYKNPNVGISVNKTLILKNGSKVNVEDIFNKISVDLGLFKPEKTSNNSMLFRDNEEGFIFELKYDSDFGELSISIIDYYVTPLKNIKNLENIFNKFNRLYLKIEDMYNKKEIRSFILIKIKNGSFNEKKYIIENENVIFNGGTIQINGFHSVENISSKIALNIYRKYLIYN